MVRPLPMVAARLDSVAFQSRDHRERFFQCRGGSDTTRKIRNVRTIPGGGRVKKNGVRAHFSPACFSVELRVFGLAMIAARARSLASRPTHHLDRIPNLRD